ncbi:MAG: TIGR00341 family protein [Brevundimonas sp.]
MSDTSATVRDTRNFVRRITARARKGVEHVEVADNVYENGGLTGRYLIMTFISAAIAILGLMLSSPAVVIGAMLMSPMMGPIVALGFSLTLLDWAELKQSLTALGIGFGLALLVAVVLTVLSPLKEPTAEILARTRPNFFDLLIAVFSGVAGAYAVIKQRGETIIGVAIATALMPPVATVGFGLGTGDLGIAGGAFFLFMTNLVAIALAATLTATFYGFRPRIREKPQPWRSFAVVLVFALLSAPLALSLRAIGLESRATAETRMAVNQIFAGAESRVTLLEVRSAHNETTVSALVSTRTLIRDAESRLQERLNAALHTPVKVSLDQIVVADPRAAARAVQASPVSTPSAAETLRTRLVDAVPFATDAVMTDDLGRAAIVLLRPDAGLDLASAYSLEKALQGRFEGVAIWVTPPIEALDTVDLGDPEAVARAAWALGRWRAQPRVSFCRPDPAPEPAEGAAVDAAVPQGAQARFVAALTTMGVSMADGEGPACGRRDRNLARIALT